MFIFHYAGSNLRLERSYKYMLLADEILANFYSFTFLTRLVFSYIDFIYYITGRIKYLTLTDANRVWMPDLFFSNEKEGHFHNIIMPNVYIRIFPYGSVLYSIRISLTLSCPMNLKLYPLDRQVCSLRMASCKFLFFF